MSKIEDLKNQLEQTRHLLGGAILKEFLTPEQYSRALPRFQELLLAVSEQELQLQAEVEAEKTKFRREAYDLFSEQLANGLSDTKSIKSGNLVAFARYTKDIPFSIPEIHSAFEREGLSPPPMKTAIDAKLLDSKQKKFYKTLERVTGVTVVVKDLGEIGRAHV